MITKYNKYGIIILVFLLLVSLPLYAGDKARIGTAAGVQVQVPVGARDLAMAGANIVYTSGVEAIYWNPAGLSSMENRAGAMFSTVAIFGDIRVNYLVLGVNMGSLGHLGFDIKTFDFGDIPLTTQQDMDGESGRTFSPTFSTIGLTYANKLTESIQVGLTAKMIYESVPRASATAFALDLGIQYKQLAGIKGVSFAVVAKNIGTDMKYEGSALMYQVQDPETYRRDYVTRGSSSNQLPASLELGLAYEIDFIPQNNIIVSGVFQNNNVQNDGLKFGLEYTWNELVSVRGGYVYTANSDVDDELYTFTLGAGIRYNVGGMDLGIDYAFRDSQYFDANSMFSIRIGF